MDAETTEAIESLNRTIAKHDESRLLAPLSFHLLGVLLCSARRQGRLDDGDIHLITTSIADFAKDPEIQANIKAAESMEFLQGSWDRAAAAQQAQDTKPNTAGSLSAWFRR